MRRAIITVVGMDAVGIIAAVSTYLRDRKINILDISQTITGGFFHMMMIVDITGVADFVNVVEDLDKLGESIGVEIHCQREEIFTDMHRV